MCSHVRFRFDRPPMLVPPKPSDSRYAPAWCTVQRSSATYCTLYCSHKWVCFLHLLYTVGTTFMYCGVQSTLLYSLQYSYSWKQMVDWPLSSSLAIAVSCISVSPEDSPNGISFVVSSPGCTLRYVADLPVRTTTPFKSSNFWSSIIVSASLPWFSRVIYNHSYLALTFLY